MNFRWTSQCLALAVALAACATSTVVAVQPASARSKEDGAKDAQDAAKEAARQAAEQAREQAKQAAEHAREQAKQAQEQARQAQKHSNEGSNAAEGQKTDNRQASTPVEQGKTAGGGEKAAGETTRGDVTGGKSGDKDKPASAGKSGPRTAEESKVPGTVAEWLQGVFAPASKQAAPAAPARVPAPAPAPDKVPPAPQTPGTGKVAGHDTPPLPSDRPEMLAVNVSQKGLARAVALGFHVNGTTQVSRIDLGLTRLVAPVGMTAEQARDLLRQELPGEGVEINQQYRIYKTATGVQPAALADPVKPATPMATPCGTDRCFGSSIINWKQPLQDCARTIKIGVIDTGYDAGHPTFRNRTIHPFRSPAAGHEKSPDWHGTGVLALLAGDAKSGTPGLVPLAKFYLADIFFADTDGAPASDTASLLAALDWLEKQHVRIINMSLTGPPDELLKTAIVKLSAKDIIFVAAVGNDGPAAPPSYPAAYEPVVAVTAVDKDLISYRYASRGEHVDVAAPGVDIWTALPGGQAGYHSGTSFAVPYVTAVLATVYKDLAQKTKAGFLKQANIVDLGAPGHDPVYGQGLLMAPLSCRPDAVPVPATASVVSGATVQASAGR